MKPSTTLPFAALLLFARDIGAEPNAVTVTGRVHCFENGHPANRSDVWVYLQDTSRHLRGPSPSLPAREIRQEKEQFVPHVIVVPVGTVVAFPNLDPIEHNVFSPTDPPGEFDLGHYSSDKKGKAHKFDDAAEVEIYCDIHKHMWARVKVVDSNVRWIAQVDADGKFTIPDVPPGTYKLHAWTYDSEEVIERMVVGGDATVDAPEMHLQLGKTRSHLRKDGTPYDSGQYQRP
jgi:hypothetical protein